MGTVMMVWVCSLLLKSIDLACLMLCKFYKACFGCCTNSTIFKSRIISQSWPTVQRAAIALQRRHSQQLGVADRQPTSVLQGHLALQFRQIHLQPADQYLDRHLPQRCLAHEHLRRLVTTTPDGYRGAAAQRLT